MVGLGYLHYLADPAPTVGAIRSVDALPTLSVSAILSLLQVVFEITFK